ncbi:uncharacterized protein LOC123921446 isoform X3 [Trifolium pratense]|uniref:uncharacterized protein LOC123921446 isoform X3 n=1 Tax=Trifolium pratense TaxID=57577 RepID=UPI001E695F6E|nr:uncharacterized protein LOC123921446 isoform X3 [Trifolium pratense]
MDQRNIRSPASVARQRRLRRKLILIQKRNIAFQPTSIPESSPNPMVVDNPSSVARQRRLERREKLKEKRTMFHVHRTHYAVRNGTIVEGSGGNSNIGVDEDNTVIFSSAEAREYSDIGDMNVVCPKCDALVWDLEKLKKNSHTSAFEVSLCCMRGKVTIPLMIEPPLLLKNLFNGVDARSRHFISNIRSYNNMFAFTSMGGKILKGENTGRGPPNFVIGGQNYHRIGSLIPNEGYRPKFAQMYIYDTEHEVTNRLSHFSDNSTGKNLDPSLVADLLKLMDDHNILVKSFRMVREFRQLNQNIPVQLRLFRNRTADVRVYNVPEISEVAALIVGDFDSSECGRDIVVREKDGHLQRIHETHSKFIPLQYPLLFPYGEDQYSEDIRRNSLTSSLSTKRRERVTLREFGAFRMQERHSEFSGLLNSKRLFQQFSVDLYSMIEAQRLSYVRNNQSNIRSGFLLGVEEAVSRGDVDASSIGSRVVLPSSFTGGRRYMFNNCQDAMAICKKFGYPDLFLTVTCNPTWEEIQRHLYKSGNSAPYRPDISCRVFQMKLEEMMNDFKKGKYFGKVIASKLFYICFFFTYKYVFYTICKLFFLDFITFINLIGLYTIEFQKRGLPHAHILLWLHRRNKLDSPKSIDSVICAELPDEALYPKLFLAVTRFMIHGPCGIARPSSPCMRNRSCSKFYPKKFVDRTTFDESGYPVYRRRDLGVTVLKKDVQLDNRSVVPYNPSLIMKYQAHVNIEFCNKSNCIKYLFKYITKGVDRVTATLQVGDEEVVDEIQQYYDCRYLSPSESIWRLFAFDIHRRWPPVQRLTFHLRDEQRVVFKDTTNLEDVLSRNRDKNTMFLAWMEANSEYDSGRSLTYCQFPTKFVYDSKKRRWKPRKQGQSIGRLTFVPHSNRELYYMRLLLNIQVGCTCFEDIRTVDGHVYDSYREACDELGLLANDREFIDAIDELSILGTGSYVRNVFSVLLLTSCMSDPGKVFEHQWENLSDGILFDRRRALNQPDLIIPSEELKQMCLIEIDKLLRRNGLTLTDFECMPKILSPEIDPYDNLLIYNELSYGSSEMLSKHDEYFKSLNEDQMHAYDIIVSAVNNKTGGMFFVDGFGGTGKTFLWNTLSFRFRSENKIVLNVASSGIASLLLPGGRTAHSQFAIPLNLTEESCCRIEKNSKKADLLVMASLIIWDEAPMINRSAFEAFDRTLRDIMSNHVGGASEIPFGGKTVVFGGDFRQILPVVPKGGRPDIVHATINSSPLWRFCTVLKLSKNMRLQSSSDMNEMKSLTDFAKWNLDIGDGKIGVDDDGQYLIEIPDDLCIKGSGDHVRDIVDAVYPELLENISNDDFFQDRAILTPTLELVEKVNDFVLSLIPGEASEYLSCDSICKCDEDVGIDRRWITTEFLNDIKCSGLPNHKLRFKVGVPVILLRNIDVSAGLCNGTRLVINHLGKTIIGARILNGSHGGEQVYVTRMKLMPSDSNAAITFERRQFPFSLCFAMTINKSQGQTLSNVGLYLPRPVFTHGQLYVAISRVKTRTGLKILIVDENGEASNTTVNFVYREVFQKI